MIKRDIPKIRFNNSKIDWQQVKFKNLLNSEEGIRRGPFGSALKKELFVQNSEYVVYEQQNAIYDHFNTRYRISEEKYHELKKFILLPGDFIMSGAGTIGKISLVPEGIENGVFNQALIRLRVNKNTDKEFFLQWMRSSKMQNKLTKANPASAMVNLVPMSEVKEWDVIVPSPEEQSAIGYLFRTLDDLLASYKDNLANYQSLKAAMLSKMFPKAGKAVPEIRLDGFEGEWRIIKLGDVLSELKSGLSRELSNDDIGLPVIRANNISDGILNLDRDIKYWFKEDPKGANTANYFVKENDILVNFINSEAKMGTAAIVLREPDRETIYTTNILKLTVKEDYYPYFIYLMTFVQSYQNYIKSITKPAVNQASFTTVDFKKYDFLCPAFREQQAIGSYFSNLDQLITSYQEKITQLETLKKKLLQDMFI